MHCDECNDQQQSPAARCLITNDTSHHAKLLHSPTLVLLQQVIQHSGSYIFGIAPRKGKPTVACEDKHQFRREDMWEDKLSEHQVREGVGEQFPLLDCRAKARIL